MSDLISRKALIESYCEENCGERRCRDAWDRCMFVSHVLEQPLVTDTNIGGKWIPCSERLPEPNKAVLVCTNTGEIDVDYYGVMCKNFIGLKGTHMKAIAWMPLPSAFVGE